MTIEGAYHNNPLFGGIVLARGKIFLIEPRGVTKGLFRMERRGQQGELSHCSTQTPQEKMYLASGCWVSYLLYYPSRK